MMEAPAPEGVAGNSKKDDHGWQDDVVGMSKPCRKAESAEHNCEDGRAATERGNHRSNDAGGEEPLRRHVEELGRRSMGANIARPT